MKIQTIQMSTSLGQAEATKTEPSTPWDIGYPWGGDRFFGSAPEVRARMKKAITAYEKSEEAVS